MSIPKSEDHHALLRSGTRSIEAKGHLRCERTEIRCIWERCCLLLDELFTPGTVWVLHVLDTALRRGTCRIEKVKIERMHGAEAARSRWNAAVSALAASTFVRGSGRTYFVFCFGGKSELHQYAARPVTEIRKQKENAVARRRAAVRGTRLCAPATSNPLRVAGTPAYARPLAPVLT